MKKSHVLLVVIMCVGIAAFVIPVFGTLSLDSLNWGLIVTILVVLTLAAFYLDFEASVTSSKEIAIIALLGAMSAVFRIPFAVMPSFQPCTYLIICTGYVFGPVAGFVVGAITVLVSNLFLGHGPWTLYQMFAWGLVGVSAGFLSRLNLSRTLLVVFGVIWGYLYGCITNLWFWTAFVYPLSLNTFIVTQLNTIWFDTVHAIGNAIFLGILGLRTIGILNRFKQRFMVSYSS